MQRNTNKNNKYNKIKDCKKCGIIIACEECSLKYDKIDMELKKNDNKC